MQISTRRRVKDRQKHSSPLMRFVAVGFFVCLVKFSNMNFQRSRLSKDTQGGRCDLLLQLNCCFFVVVFVSSLQLQCTHEVSQHTLEISSFFVSATVNLDSFFSCQCTLFLHKMALFIRQLSRYFCHLSGGLCMCVLLPLSLLHGCASHSGYMPRHYDLVFLSSFRATCLLMQYYTEQAFLLYCCLRSYGVLQVFVITFLHFFSFILY